VIRNLFNNRAFVIVLAVCSGLLMLRSLAAPFLEQPDFDDVEDPEFFLAETDIDGITSDEPLIWRADQSVLSGQLTWNDSPARDPFVRMAVGPGAVDLPVQVLPAATMDGLPRLDALVAGPKSLLAVLNNRIVREGDLIGAYQVTRIRPDGVRIASRHETHWLSVADMTLETDDVEDDELMDAPADELAGLIEGGEPGP